MFVPATLLCYRMPGTLAARLQSWIGNVAAGSLFAIAQGTAMGARIPTRAKVICGIVTVILCLIFVPYAQVIGGSVTRILCPNFVPYFQVIVAYARVIVAYARVIVAHARANVACAQVIFGITTGIASSIFVAFARVILGTITGIVGLVFAFFA